MKRFVFLLFFVATALIFCGCDTLSFQPFKNSTESDGKKTEFAVDSKPIYVSKNAESGEIVVKSVIDAVVGISSRNASYSSIGSGVAVASNGYVLTNQHVVEGAKNVNVFYSDGKEGNASVVWSDANIDLALIKCDRDMNYLEMSSATALLPGEDILAIGTPISLQFKHSVTKGVVSATNRIVETESGYLQNLIQHDSSLNPGNSGGPLVNMRGQLVGINTLKASDAEGLGFAIPIDVAIPIIEKISKNGTFNPPLLGIYGLDASVANYNNLTKLNTGVYVAGGEGKNSDIIEGDVIVKFAGREIKNMLDLRVALFYQNSGDTIEVELNRENKLMTIQITLN